MDKLTLSLTPIFYERLSAGDEFLNQFEGHFLQALKEELLEDPYSSFASLMLDLEESCHTAGALIDSYLAEQPIDVFQVEISKTGGRT